MKRSYYVGIAEGKKVVFSCAEVPTPTSHPEYGACIGPFRTKRAALFMAASGNSPNCRTVADAERLSKEYT